MKLFAKIVLGAVLVIAAAVAAVLIGARFSDGPLEIIAGGPFTTGELQSGPPVDWSFMRDVETIEFQSLEPPRSRTVWVLAHEGRMFIPCGYMNSTWGRIWKQWPVEAERDGRIITRIDGKLYNQNLVRIQDGPILEPLLAEMSRKYAGGQPIPVEVVTSGAFWFFEVTPRA
ncbi:MAG: hypothetical protein F4X81_04185 [Gammaproteobacteria bacterium]|nr:hypothetical protein [Gammaproteobacteria bacterium]MYE50648.1 hypothetical protein [Gammaproteobacteria bacterium]